MHAASCGHTAASALLLCSKWGGGEGKKNGTNPIFCSEREEKGFPESPGRPSNISQRLEYVRWLFLAAMDTGKMNM